ncbi:Aspartate carbamoyltransferase [Trichinella pseudospiralis]
MTARNQNKKEMVRLIKVTVRKILNLQASSLWDKRIRQCRFGVIWHHRGPLTHGKQRFGGLSSERRVTGAENECTETARLHFSMHGLISLNITPLHHLSCRTLSNILSHVIIQCIISASGSIAQPKVWFAISTICT